MNTSTINNLNTSQEYPIHKFALISFTKPIYRRPHHEMQLLYLLGKRRYLAQPELGNFKLLTPVKTIHPHRLYLQHKQCSLLVLFRVWCEVLPKLNLRTRWSRDRDFENLPIDV